MPVAQLPLRSHHSGPLEIQGERLGVTELPAQGRWAVPVSGARSRGPLAGRVTLGTSLSSLVASRSTCTEGAAVTPTPGTRRRTKGVHACDMLGKSDRDSRSQRTSQAPGTQRPESLRLRLFPASPPPTLPPPTSAPYQGADTAGLSPPFSETETQSREAQALPKLAQ